MVKGRIIKGIAGFYYVKTFDRALYECRARGIFRKDHIKPMVGDYVMIEILDEQKKTGNIDSICPRYNELIRPMAANIDQALVIFSATSPKPNFNLLDRFLLTMEKQKVETVICFNKMDLASEEEYEQLKQNYSLCGYEILYMSVKQKKGLERLDEVLKNKTTTVAGPSGVGKSSLVNELQSAIHMETGGISAKIDRGKHTTRHSELIFLNEGTYIVDTPGFSSLFIEQFEKNELKDYFREFVQFEPRCRFQDCVHLDEPGCGVKEAVEAGRISRSRYENYRILYEELRDRKKVY